MLDETSPSLTSTLERSQTKPPFQTRRGLALFLVTPKCGRSIPAHCSSLWSSNLLLLRAPSTGRRASSDAAVRERHDYFHARGERRKRYGAQSRGTGRATSMQSTAGEMRVLSCVSTCVVERSTHTLVRSVALSRPLGCSSTAKPLDKDEPLSFVQPCTSSTYSRDEKHCPVLLRLKYQPRPLSSRVHVWPQQFHRGTGYHSVTW